MESVTDGPGVADPNAPRFFLLGTKYGGSQDVLPRMVLDGVISTGFAANLDLSRVIGADYSLALNWIEKHIPGQSGVAKRTLALFASLKPGDLVALKAFSAPIRTQPRLVIARYAVVSGYGRAAYARSNVLGHTLKADFLDEQVPIELPLGYGQTLYKIEAKDRIDLIFGHYGKSAKSASKELSELRDKAIHSSEVAARGPYLMRRLHNELQNELRELLVAKYGQDTTQLQIRSIGDLRLF